MILASRFKGFIEQIRESTKLIPRMLLDHILCDVEEEIWDRYYCKLTSVEHLVKEDISGLQYHPTLPGDKWKGGLMKEILDLGRNKLEIEGFD